MQDSGCEFCQVLRRDRLWNILPVEKNRAPFLSAQDIDPCGAEEGVYTGSCVS